MYRQKMASSWQGHSRSSTSTASTADIKTRLAQTYPTLQPDVTTIMDMPRYPGLPRGRLATAVEGGGQLLQPYQVSVSEQWDLADAQDVMAKMDRMMGRIDDLERARDDLQRAREVDQVRSGHCDPLLMFRGGAGQSLRGGTLTRKTLSCTL